MPRKITVLVNSGVDPDEAFRDLPEQHRGLAKLRFLEDRGFEIEKRFQREAAKLLPRVEAYFGALKGTPLISERAMFLPAEDVVILQDLALEFRSEVLDALEEWLEERENLRQQLLK